MTIDDIIAKLKGPGVNEDALRRGLAGASQDTIRDFWLFFSALESGTIGYNVRRDQNMNCRCGKCNTPIEVTADQPPSTCPTCGVRIGFGEGAFFLSEQP